MGKGKGFLHRLVSSQVFKVENKPAVSVCIFSHGVAMKCLLHGPFVTLDNYLRKQEFYSLTLPIHGRFS